MPETNLGSAATLIGWVVAHKLFVFTVVSAFGIAFCSAMKDGAGMAKSISGAFVCVFFAIPAVYFLRKLNIYPDYIMWVGVLFGALGAEFLRTLTRGFVDEVIARLKRKFGDE